MHFISLIQEFYYAYFTKGDIENSVMMRTHKAKEDEINTPYFLVMASISEIKYFISSNSNFHSCFIEALYLKL